MQIEAGVFLRFVKLCCYSGAFSVVSLASFSMVYYFTTPEAERFVLFLKAEAVGNWLHYNFFGWEIFGLSLLILSLTLLAAASGFVSGIIAKVTYERAQDVLKSGLGREDTRHP